MRRDERRLPANLHQRNRRFYLRLFVRIHRLRKQLHGRQRMRRHERFPRTRLSRVSLSRRIRTGSERRFALRRSRRMHGAESRGLRSDVYEYVWPLFMRLPHRIFRRSHGYDSMNVPSRTADAVTLVTITTEATLINIIF